MDAVVVVTGLWDARAEAVWEAKGREARRESVGVAGHDLAVVDGCTVAVDAVAVIVAVIGIDIDTLDARGGGRIVLVGREVAVGDHVQGSGAHRDGRGAGSSRRRRGEGR